MIPAFDPSTGALPPGNHQATLEEIRKRLGFTPRRQWLLKGLRAAVEAFWAAGIQEIYIDGSIWSVGYFVSSIGIDEERIKRYIAYQGKQDRGRTLRLGFS